MHHYQNVKQKKIICLIGGFDMSSYYPKKYNVGDIVETRKVHPCGSKEWEVIRVGADFKIKCNGCGRLVMLPRVKFEKSVKKIIKAVEPEEIEL